MNKQINHEETIKAIEEASRYLASHYETCKVYNNKLGEIVSNENLSEKGKYEEKAKVTDAFKVHIEENICKIEECVKIAREIEEANMQILELDNLELMNAVNIINVMGSKLDYDNKKQIIESTKGNYQAQVLIRSLFDKFEINYKEFKSFVVNPSIVFTQLEEEVSSLRMQPEKSINSASIVEKTFNNILKNIGSDVVIDIGIDNSEYLDKLAKSVMGV